MAVLTLAAPEKVRAPLLAWFDRNRRDLPWRRTRNPWEILVAEFMLQQTRSEVVAGRYGDFLRRFPDFASLAAARVDEVEAAWSGLGYYQRARNLHRTACILAERAGLPQDQVGWAELPGIGDYTSAMMASRCNGEASPALDGNVERVLARLLALDQPPGRASARRRMLSIGRRLLVPGRAGESNQAMMEVGSLLCRRSRPDCTACPLAPGCRAHRTPSLDPAAFPMRPPRRARERLHCFSAVVRLGEALLLHRRPADDWLGGRWHLPTVTLPAGAEADRAAALLGGAFGGRWDCRSTEVVVRHAVTWRDLVVRAAPCRWDPAPTVSTARPARPATAATMATPGSSRPALAWFGPAEVAGLPTSSLLPKTLARLDRRRLVELGPAGGGAEGSPDGA